MDISFRQYLKSIDPYSSFLTYSEYKAFKAAQRNTYAGVGMDIENDGKGNIICFPFSGSPSAAAGIESGDILVEIDGITIKEKSLLEVVPLIRGDVNTPVALTVMGSSGQLKKIALTRRNVRDDSVQLDYYGNIPIISIQTFRPETSRELRFAMESLEDNPAVIIDLRGNGGGDFHAAMDASILFLKKGEKIIEVQTRKKSKPYFSSNDDQYPGKAVFLLQDERTASAAEVFIAALTENGRARSLGKTTFGKGTVQEIFELSDGSAIFLTTGYLITPKGFRYNGLGLNPDYEVDSNKVSMDLYISKIKKLLYPPHVRPKIPLAENKRSIASEDRPDDMKWKKNKEDREDLNPETPEMSPEKEYVICLEKKFLSNKEAETWYDLNVKGNFSIEPYYILQKVTPEGVKYFICFDKDDNQPSLTEGVKNLRDASGISTFLLKVPAQ